MHRRDATRGLGKIMVTDFHSAADAEAAAAVFNAVVCRKEFPADIATVPEPPGLRVHDAIRVDKLLARVGLAESVSDAVRKIKTGAVQINLEKERELLLKD